MAKGHSSKDLHADTIPEATAEAKREDGKAPAKDEAVTVEMADLS